MNTINVSIDVTKDLSKAFVQVHIIINGKTREILVQEITNENKTFSDLWQRIGILLNVHFKRNKDKYDSFGS